MTEAEWLSCAHPMPMLEVLRGKASDRKLRVFACACYWQVWHCLRDARSRTAVEVGERYADGRASEEERNAAWGAAFAVRTGNPLPHGARYAAHETGSGADFLAEQASFEIRLAQSFGGDGGEMPEAVGEGWRRQVEVVAAECPSRVEDEPNAAHPALLREIFGNPFRTIQLDRAWRTPEVVGLAQAAYENRDLPSGCLDPTRLAVLADALEDAGLTDAEVLGHLRSDGPHVRGCWAVDAALGQK